MRRLGGLAALLLIAACGAPAEDGPRDVAADQRPRFADGAASTGGTELPARGGVFFVADDRLVLVRIPLPSGLQRPAEQVTAALEAVIEGPSAAQSGSGVTTAVPGETRLNRVTVADGVARVDVSDAFASAANSAQLLALAQLVYTATSIPGVEAMRLLIDGESVTAPVESGELTTAPLRRSDYPSSAPRGA